MCIFAHLLIASLMVSWWSRHVHKQLFEETQCVGLHIELKPTASHLIYFYALPNYLLSTTVCLNRRSLHLRASSHRISCLLPGNSIEQLLSFIFTARLLACNQFSSYCSVTRTLISCREIHGWKYHLFTGQGLECSVDQCDILRLFLKSERRQYCFRCVNYWASAIRYSIKMLIWMNSSEFNVPNSHLSVYLNRIRIM